MATVAVEQTQFRKQTGCLQMFVLQQAQHRLCCNRLAQCPHLDVAVDWFTCHIVVIENYVRVKQLGESVEFEADARMPRTHDFMGDELIAGAVVAGQAQARALDDVVGRIETVGDILSARGVFVGMRGDVFFGATVAGFSADAIVHRKFYTLVFLWNITRMAGQAGRFQMRCL